MISNKTMVIVGSMGSILPITLMILCVIPESKLIGFAVGTFGVLLSCIYIVCGLIGMQKSKDNLQGQDIIKPPPNTINITEPSSLIEAEERESSDNDGLEA